VSRSSAPIRPTTSLSCAQNLPWASRRSRLDAPEISDSEYDRLFRELQGLEAADPEL
jgi:NAD-dependent DNA ligase